MSKDRILIVEDQLDILSLLKLYFTGHGYEVFTATRGLEGLRLCQEKQPHIVLLDVGLPDLGLGEQVGFEIGRRLRQMPHTRHIPIVFLTALSDLSSRKTGLGEVQARQYIVKPFDMEEVYTIVRNILQEGREHNQFHPITGLPMAKIVDEQLTTLLEKESWALATIYINHFEAFRSLYGAMAAETALKSTASLLSEVITVLGTPEDFVGQQKLYPGFLIISTQEKIRLIGKQLIASFGDRMRPHYNFRDWKRAFIEVEAGRIRRLPQIALAIGILSNRERAVSSLEALKAAINDTQQLALAAAHEQGGKSVVYERTGNPGLVADEQSSAELIAFVQAIEAMAVWSDDVLLAVSVIAEPGDGLELGHQELLRLPATARHSVALSALDWALILPAATLETAIDHMIDAFEAHPIHRLHQGLRFSFGWAGGPARYANELIEAAARDQLERCYSQGILPRGEPAILSLERERRPLLRHYKELRQSYDTRRAQLEATGDTSEQQIQAHIDRLVAVLDHDLKNSLTAIRSAVELLPSNSSDTPTAPEMVLVRTQLERTVTLCRLWQRSMVESGSDKQVSLSSIEMVAWIKHNLRQLAACIGLSATLELESQAASLRTSLDPQTLMIACLHILIAVHAVGAQRLRVIAGSLGPSGQPALVFEDDGNDYKAGLPRADALQDEISWARYTALPTQCKNLVLIHKALRRQGVAIHCQQQDGLLRLIWTLPREAQMLPFGAADLGRWRSPAPLFGDEPAEPGDATYTVLTLDDLKRAVAGLQQELLGLEARHDMLTRLSHEDLVVKAVSLLRPIIHELSDQLQQLINWATALRTLAQTFTACSGQAVPYRIYNLALYSYLLVRNMVLALEGTSPAPESVDLNAQISQVVELLHHKLGARSMHLDLAADLPSVRIAQVEIKQVLMNLLKNAAEATADDGVISISTARRDEVVAIEVRDTGIGIPPEHGVKIFELNFSTKTMHRAGPMNSGVGLFAVRSIVSERVGGSIRVASATPDGQGGLQVWSHGFEAGAAPVWNTAGSLFQIDLPVASEGRDDTPHSRR